MYSYDEYTLLRLGLGRWDAHKPHVPACRANRPFPKPQKTKTRPRARLFARLNALKYSVLRRASSDGP